ncbi:hypothetical protein Tsubulata_009221 [Turnera subulata]|uniref:Uncharacterized protein n=1 Tax=Turnera subulata TaxID=218843 RepID=A0A9Q0F0T9_9ROSI|nr:hypothetical protein Tsubulata_009221 [Turnera subulata]
MAATTPSSSGKNHQASSRPANPNSRNSEISNPMRRSFSGSPFAKPSIISGQRIGFNPNTPVNSPSDYPRRHSFSRENMVVSLREHEDKENGKEASWKQAKVRSPASSKGTKNFMSPTISAASKVNASPRKRILSERNEPARTSISFSDGKSPLMEDLDSKPQKVLNQKKEVSFDSTVTYFGEEGHGDIDSGVPSSTEDDCVNFESKPADLTIDGDSVNLDPSFKISPRDPGTWTSPALAPLDADPSVPPYDPKTNYLSPRPQFLHYRPNPRVELYLNKEKDGQKLEECFASEVLSDSEFTEEESDGSVKESEDISSNGLPKEEEEKEKLEEVGVEQQEELELPVSEPEPEPEPISDSDEVTEVKVVGEDKRVSKPGFFTRRKVNALLLVLAAASLWLLVANSPIMEPSVLNNLSFSELYLPPEISEFSRQHFGVAFQKLQLWLHQSFSYSWNLIIGFSERHKLGPLQFANLSTLLENGLVDGYLVFDHSFEGVRPEYEKNVLEPIRDQEAYINPLVGESEPTEAYESTEEVLDGDSIDQGLVEQENNEAFDQNLEFSDEQGVTESEEVFVDPQAKVREPGSFEEEVVMQGSAPASTVQQQNNADIEEQWVQTELAAETQLEVITSKELQGFDDLSSPSLEESVAEETNLSTLRSDAAIERPPSSEQLASAVDRLQDIFAVKKRLGISLLVLCSLATLALIHMKSHRPTIPNAAATLNQVPIAKKMYNSPTPVSDKAIHERRSSTNCQTEVDMVSESCCPSEMSSFQNSLSSKKLLDRTTTEAQSQERKPRKNYRRESLASSDYSLSMGSPSYGSFTTYERIAGKLGNGEDEVITPVRRSSRIRKQVTSP